MTDVMRFLTAVYARLLRLYPPGFRAEFAEEMLAVFSAALEDARAAGAWPAVRCILRELAALPASRTAEVLDAIHPVFPQFIDGKNVLQTGLNNMGAIFHPALALLNAGWIEATSGDFQFYVDGVTPSVAKVLEVLDRERVTVSSALGLKGRNALEWLELAYNATGENLYEAMHNQTGYYGIKAPGTLNHRYITEEIPMSLVPIASFADAYGVSVNGINSIINLACYIHGTDYRRKGRTVERLGIKELSVGELVRFVETGERD
mgnify:CR=1 FL=1